MREWDAGGDLTKRCGACTFYSPIIGTDVGMCMDIYGERGGDLLKPEESCEGGYKGMIKYIRACDSCGKELKVAREIYHINFVSDNFCDAAGDIDYDAIRVELCETCAKEAVNSLKIIAQRGELDL